MANDRPGADTIAFNLPGDGTHDIFVTGLWGPANIKGKVTIDGYTQPGSAPNTSQDPLVNNAQIKVNLINIAPSGPGLAVWGNRASGSQIRGLGFFNRTENSSARSGLEVRQANFVTVDGCVFGATGGTRLAQAVILRNANYATIGGVITGNPAQQNVMRNYDVGVELIGASEHNAIVSNLVGGEPQPHADPIQKVGILVRPSSRQNTIARNVLYKNITQLDIQSTNVIENNILIPR